MKLLLRIWLYGIPTGGILLACLIYWFSPVDRWLVNTAIPVLLILVLVVNFRARKLERKHGFDAFPEPLNLTIFCVLGTLLVFSIVAGFKGNLSKMIGIVPLMGITCTMPLSSCKAFSKLKKAAMEPSEELA